MPRLIAIAVVLTAVLVPAAAAAAPAHTITLVDQASKPAFHKRHNVPFPATTEAAFKAPAGHGYKMAALGRRVNFSPAELKKFSGPTASSYSTVFLDLSRGTRAPITSPQKGRSAAAGSRRGWGASASSRCASSPIGSPSTLRIRTAPGAAPGSNMASSSASCASRASAATRGCCADGSLGP